MIKEVVGSVMTVGIAVVLLAVIIPMLETAKSAVWQQVNASNPTNAQLLLIGDNVFYGIILLVVIISGLTILAYATRRDPFGNGGLGGGGQGF